MHIQTYAPWKYKRYIVYIQSYVVSPCQTPPMYLPSYYCFAYVFLFVACHSGGRWAAWLGNVFALLCSVLFETIMRSELVSLVSALSFLCSINQMQSSIIIVYLLLTHPKFKAYFMSLRVAKCHYFSAIIASTEWVRIQARYGMETLRWSLAGAEWSDASILAFLMSWWLSIPLNLISFLLT